MLKKVFSLIILSLIVFTSFADDSSDQKRRKVKGCITHVVNVDEDLPSVLSKYCVTLDDLTQYNPYITTQELKTGDTIYIPKNKIGKATASDIASSTQAIEQAKKEEEIIVKENEKDIENSITPQKSSKVIEHTILQGETFYSISKLYDVTILSIMENNPSVVQNDLVIGSTLKIVKEGNDVDNTYLDSDSDNIKTDDVEINFNTPIGYKKPIKEFDNPLTSINVALLLPLKTEERESKQFTEFYQGFLVGIDSLKSEGVSITLDVFNTDKNNDLIPSIINSGRLDNCDLIVGPVYDQQFSIVSRYAAARDIPIVSPLGVVSSNNHNIFQIAPDESKKYDKLTELLANKKIIYFTTNSDDKEFVADIKRLAIESEFLEIPFNIKSDVNDFLPILSSSVDNLFIIASTNESDADAVISKVGAIKGMGNGVTISTLANPKVAWFRNLEPANFFKSDLSYITSYHADRTNKKVIELDTKFINSFHSIPSLYAYRGYDVALFFLGSMKEFGSDFYEYIADYYTTILQVTYKFNQSDANSSFINREWLLVNFAPNYDIIVK